VNKMDWNKDTDVTLDYSVHSHGDDKTTAVISQLVELTNLITNHLGSNINPNDKPTTPAQKTAKKVDVIRLANAVPIVQNISKANNRKLSRDFTGRSINKEDIDSVVEEEMKDYSQRNEGVDEQEKLLPQLAAVAGAYVGNEIMNDSEKKADAMTTSEGKALLTSLQEAANKLRKFLMTTRVDSSQALKPNDMRPNLGQMK
tara:strand:- start:3420 stop:4022 length:603 start_codon:yes stop_codon:yes gene_type:complete